MEDILTRLADSSQNESSHELQCRCFDAAEEIRRLRAAITETLDENGHLADGEICTLIKLKMVMPNNESNRLAQTINETAYGAPVERRGYALIWR